MSLTINRIGGSGGVSESNAILMAHVPTRSTVTASKGGVILTPKMWTSGLTADEDVAMFIFSPAQFDSVNTWTITATDGMHTTSSRVLITSNKEYEAVLKYFYLGDLYYGTYDSSVAHTFVTYNGAVVTDEQNYIKASLPGGTTREGGVQFGPLLLGGTYVFEFTNNNSDLNILFAGGANLSPVQRVSDMSLIVEDNVQGGGSSTLTLDTSSYMMQNGYIYVWAYFDYSWSNNRLDNRFIRISAMEAT